MCCCTCFFPMYLEDLLIFIHCESNVWGYLIMIVLGVLVIFQCFRLIDKISKVRMDEEINKSDIKQVQQIKSFREFLDKYAMYIRLIWNSCGIMFLLYTMRKQPANFSLGTFLIFLIIAFFILAVPEWFLRKFHK